eukprot:scaffold221_cov351-Pavlova_lutheri.AAC.24
MCTVGSSLGFFLVASIRVDRHGLVQPLVPPHVPMSTRASFPPRQVRDHIPHVAMVSEENIQSTPTSPTGSGLDAPPIPHCQGRGQETTNSTRMERGAPCDLVHTRMARTGASGSDHQGSGFARSLAR